MICWINKSRVPVRGEAKTLLILLTDTSLNRKLLLTVKNVIIQILIKVKGNKCI